jgi:hypothetical protein
VFDIEFATGEPEAQEEGWSALWGHITLGDYSEQFLASLELWDRSGYQRHWIAAAQRLLEGERTTGFVTSAFQFRWNMWRQGQTVVAQEQLMWTVTTKEVLDPHETYWLIGNRETVSESGEPISEWQLPIEDIAEFVARRAKEYLAAS